jgi:hypothetical protein
LREWTELRHAALSYYFEATVRRSWSTEAAKAVVSIVVILIIIGSATRATNECLARQIHLQQACHVNERDKDNRWPL